MGEPMHVLQELLAKYEESVEAKQRELERFRYEANAHISALEKEIAKHREAIHSLRAGFDGTLLETAQSNESEKRRNVARGRQTHAIRQFVASEMAKGEVSLTRREICRRIENSNLVFSTSNLSELVRAALSRDSSFEYDRFSGYRLRRL